MTGDMTTPTANCAMKSVDEVQEIASSELSTPDTNIVDNGTSPQSAPTEPGVSMESAEAMDTCQGLGSANTDGIQEPSVEAESLFQTQDIASAVHPSFDTEAQPLANSTEIEDACEMETASVAPSGNVDLSLQQLVGNSVSGPHKCDQQTISNSHSGAENTSSVNMNTNRFKANIYFCIGDLVPDLEAEVPAIMNDKDHKVAESMEQCFSVKSQPVQVSSHSSSAIVESEERYVFSQARVPRLTWETTFDYDAENFLRGCIWSPKGTHLVANSNDNCLRVYDQESNSYGIFKQGTVIKEGSQIYDFAWLPSESSDPPQVANTSSGIPIHLWNANTGQLSASYKAYDQNDEITAAYSIAFSPDGEKLYAGYKKGIRIFKTDRPGRDCEKVPPYDKCENICKQGIISCISTSTVQPGFFAAGSYSRQVGLYDDRMGQGLVCTFKGHHGGITSMQFSPDGTKLYTGGRKDPDITCYDMRKPGSIIFTLLRDVQTNQRMYFDQSSSGRYLFSGNHGGTVMVWDIKAPTVLIEGEYFIKPTIQFFAHYDCVNSVSLNHKLNLLATGSGQRHFDDFEQEWSDDSSDEGLPLPQRAPPRHKDFSIRLWSIFQEPLLT